MAFTTPQFDPITNLSNQPIFVPFFSGSLAFLPPGVSTSSFFVTGVAVGDLLEDSSSIIIELEPTTGKHLQFRTPSSSLGTSDDKIQFFISNSLSPKIGIGTNAPLSTLDIVDVEDSAEGFVFLIRNARTTTEGGQLGDAAGTVNFIITSGSYNNITTSGSVGKITSTVTAIDNEGAAGNLAFEVADKNNPKAETTQVLSLQKDSNEDEDVVASITGSAYVTKVLYASQSEFEDRVWARSLLITDSTPEYPGNNNAKIQGILDVGSITTTTITASSDISASGAITGSDVYIDDWGSVSASLSAAGGGGAVATYTNGVDNRVITSTGTDSINGEANLTFDGSTLGVIGTVGIGTNNPIYQLHVSSSTAALGVYERAGGAALYLEGQLTQGVMGTVGSHPLLIAYNSGEVARFTGTSFLVTGSLDVSTSITGSDVNITDFPSVSASLASAGNVSNTGTPSDNQIAVFTDATTIEGNSGFTYDGTTLNIQANTHNLDGGDVVIEGNTTIYGDGGLETIGDITGSDVNITDFPSVSASLASAGNVNNTGTPLNNQVAIWTNSTTIEGDADFTWSGTILTIDGSTKTRVTAVANDGVGGTVNAAGEFGYGAEVWQGPGVSDTTAGKVYYLASGGTMTLASSGSAAAATGFLSYATSTFSVNGMVLRGFVYVSGLGASPGDKIYLADGGNLTTTAPTTSTHFVRIVGYASANSNIIYFNPSNDYIQLA